MTSPLALIEPNAGSMGGHHYPALEALLRSAARQGVPVTFISVKGLSPGARDAVAAAGVGVRWRPSAAQPLAWFLLVAGYALEWLSRLRTRTPGWGVAYQWEVASRCLLEAASLRIAPPGACCVILTASERLHGTTVALSGVPHVRVIHDMRTREGPVLSRLERRLERGRARVIAVCTTEAVRDELEELYPGIAAQVQTFTLADPDLYIAHGERGAARRAFGFGDDDFVAAIVGGWWRTKDMGTVERGLARAERPVGAIVAGHPIDPELLERMRQSCRGRLVALPRELAADELRRVYAAADVSVVSRIQGVAKESGLVMDAARYGVPVVVSDHDFALSRRLEKLPWARTYRAQDADALASALAEVAERPLERPSPEAARRLGMLSPDEALLLYGRLGDEIAGEWMG